MLGFVILHYQSNTRGVDKVITRPIWRSNISRAVRHHIFVVIDATERNFRLVRWCWYNESFLLIRNRLDDTKTANTDYVYLQLAGQPLDTLVTVLLANARKSLRTVANGSTMKLAFSPALYFRWRPHVVHCQWLANIYETDTFRCYISEITFIGLLLLGRVNGKRRVIHYGDVDELLGILDDPQDCINVLRTANGTHLWRWTLWTTKIIFLRDSGKHGFGDYREIWVCRKFVFVVSNFERGGVVEFSAILHGPGRRNSSLIFAHRPVYAENFRCILRQASAILYEHTQFFHLLKLRIFQNT